MNEYLSWGALIAFIIFVVQQGVKTWFDYKKSKAEVIFTKLHQERANAIKEMHCRIIELDIAMGAFMKYSSNQDIINNLHNALDSSVDFFSKHKIYFSSKLASHVEEVLIRYIKSEENLLFFNKKVKVSGLGFNSPVMNQERDAFRVSFKKDIEKLLLELEQEFRLVLGTK